MNAARSALQIPATLLTLAILACDAASVAGGQGVTVAITPETAYLAPSAQQVFAAAVNGTIDQSVTWTIAEGPTGGVVTDAGLYTAPASAGNYHVIATSNADPTKSASAIVAVTNAGPGPGGPHPRLWMSGADIAAYQAKQGTPGAAAKGVIDDCASTGYPQNGSAFQQYIDSGPAVWPLHAATCAFAYKVTGNAAYLTKALTWWRGTLNNRATWGDNDGCTTANLAAENPTWRQTWNGDSATRPRILQVVLGDTGYPMRNWPPFIVMAYDWLHGAPGVDASLLQQTRECVTAWLDNYRIRGYLRDRPGGNYNAGYVGGKALAAVAFSGDGVNGPYDDADGHLWAELETEVFARDLVGKGFATSKPIGTMTGGDWGSWQYAPGSVIEYALATRALVDNGSAQPLMTQWISDLVLRQYHAMLPTFTREHCGIGDNDDSHLFHAVSATQLNAALAGPTTDALAGRAQFLKNLLGATGGSPWDAIAERRSPAPVDYRASDPPTWYVAKGTGTMFSRTSWTSSAYWAAFSAHPAASTDESPSTLDHAHNSGGTFVFTRGGDGIVVDASNYGESATRESNAPWVEVSVFPGTSMYNGGQTPWGTAPLTWARGTTDKTHAARTVLTRAFDNNGGVQPPDLAFMQRDWVMLAEGEVVTIDRARVTDATRGMGVQFHTDTAAGGGLVLSSGAYVGTVTGGTSKVAIHPVYVSSGSPAARSLTRMGCSLPICGGNYTNCSYCDNQRMPIDEYSVRLTGLWNVAIHAIDGYAASGADSSPATTTNLATLDANNSGVIGAGVLRSGVQSYVVASSLPDGASPPTMTYRVPSSSTSRHVVFDAPENAGGQSTVTASLVGATCAISVNAGPGFTGRPLMFTVAGGSCAVTELTNAPADAGP